ncbi:MAG: bifunctional diguanylate cyclase/phosphodiesterase [Pseudomonadota bacterium]
MDLTQELRSISDAVQKPSPQSDNAPGVVLLTRDAKQRKWGERWLKNSGLNVSVPTVANLGELVDACLATDAVVIDSALKTKKGDLFYRVLMGLSPSLPIFAICNNQREINEATEAEPYDVIDKPIKWEFVARRVARAVNVVRMQSRINKNESVLREALSFADKTRAQLRTNESVDPITGLPNRAKFMQILSRAVVASTTQERALAVFVINLPRFGLVVEAHGQRIADEMLQRVGGKLSQCLAVVGSTGSASDGMKSAVLSYLGNSRFAMMLSWPGDRDTMDDLCRRLNDTLASSIDAPGQRLHLSACAGVAQYPDDADNIDSLMQRAENAMRVSQERGSGLTHYCAATDAAADRKLHVEQLLSDALIRGDMRVAYQPILSVADDKLVAVEALLRWDLPDGQSIQPDEFVPVAEESGLMMRLGEFVLRTAVEQAREWELAGFDSPLMCVNVAKTQLMQDDFVESVDQVLKQTKLSPSRLELELSERGVLAGSDEAVERLQALKDIGVRLAADDFGTGESAIMYLKRLPIDVLKIDKSYISGIVDDARDGALASGMISLGHGLGLQVVAEGVEHSAQLEALQGLSCDTYQGFLVSRAITPEEIEDRFLSRWSGETLNQSII